METKFKIGDTVYIRNYSNRNRNDLFHARKIVNETSRSWVVGNDPWDEQKFPKKVDPKVARLYTYEEMQEAVWLEKNQHKIVAELQYGQQDPAVFRKIAELIGYKEETK